MSILHHVALSTTDLERSISFYIQHFGAREVRRNKWDGSHSALNERFGLKDSSADVALIEIGGAFLEIFEFKNLPENENSISNWRPGFTHICLQVENCQDTFDDLQRNGVSFSGAPLTMPTGATFAYARDPDGNTVEILEVPSDCPFPSLL